MKYLIVGAMEANAHVEGLIIATGIRHVPQIVLRRIALVPTVRPHQQKWE